MADPRRLVHEIDVREALDFLAAMIRFRSYTCCFFGTDAAHLRHRAGMPGVVCGPGGRYNTMPDERADIPDFIDAIRIYLLTILDICGIDG